MQDRLVIAMTCWRRPDVLAQSLAALAQCQGVEHCLLLPYVEPGFDEVRSLVEGFSACECRPTWNRERLGCDDNTLAAWSNCLAIDEYVLLVEEDIILATDALTYFSWCRDRYRDDPNLASVTSYNRRATPVLAAEHHTVKTRVWFHPWGVATWRNRGILGMGTGNPGTWDSRINLHYLDHGFREAFPELSRSNNIGLVCSRQDQGCPPPEWYAEHHVLHQGAWNHEVRPGDFHEDTETQPPTI